MTMTLGTGPFGQVPGGAFNFSPPAAGILYLERSPRRVRAVREGVTVVDSLQPWVLHESGALPRYYFSPADVRTDLLRSLGRAPGSALRGEAERYALHIDGRVTDGAAWSHPLRRRARRRGWRGCSASPGTPWTSGGRRTSACTCTCAIPTTGSTCSTARAT